MAQTSEEQLTHLQEGCRRGSSAIRLRADLEPVGGPGTKVFPPTYEGGLYATERRLLDGREVDAVLLDSVQSQANRAELGLLSAFERGECAIPVMVSDLGERGRLTALELPHRCFDAYFVYSSYDGVPFFESDPGRRLRESRPHNATGIFTYCPTGLVFGCWDSHTGDATRAAKFPRALSAEIVALEAISGVRPASRIDPLNLSREGDLRPPPGDIHPPRQTREKKRERLSEYGFGNVTPSFRGERGEERPGGVTLSRALQTATLSFPTLRRLRFPTDDGELELERDVAGRGLLAALALYALALQLEEGYDLRSGCQLVPTAAPEGELVGTTAQQSSPWELEPETARATFEAAAALAREHGLTWEDGYIEFLPSEWLAQEVLRREAELLAEQ